MKAKMLAAIAVVVTGAALTTASPASASANPALDQCLANGDGTVNGVFDAEVARFSQNAGTVTLGCGTSYSTGLLHIVDGTDPHPVTAQTGDAFLNCVAQGVRGTQDIVPTSLGNTSYGAEYDYNHNKIIVIVSTGTRKVVTAYTTAGAQGADWAACAA